MLRTALCCRAEGGCGRGPGGEERQEVQRAGQTVVGRPGQVPDEVSPCVGEGRESSSTGRQGVDFTTFPSQPRVESGKDWVVGPTRRTLPSV